MALSRLLRRLWRPAFDAPLAPLRPIYAVGDLHGRANLLDAMLTRIDADAAARGLSDAVVVFLGDYIDRGEESAQVIARLRAELAARGEAGVALMGNHEAMLLEFLADPVQRGRHWLRHGGSRTLASYGVRGVTEGAGQAELRRSADALRAAMPEGEAAWLAALPARWQSGNVVCVHAGADPREAILGQDVDTLIWGHPDFARVPRTDGQWVVHGHTIVDQPHASAGRLALDTGAFYSGRLTAALIQAGKDPAFLEVTG